MLTKMYYWQLRACATTLILLFVAGCETTPTTETTERRQPTFDFTPPEFEDIDSHNVRFAVTNANVSTSLDRYKMEETAASVQTHPAIVENFARSMTTDFEEVLIARGFAVRGPFDSFDEMTFPDRSESDLILTAEVDIVPEYQNLRAEASRGLLGNLDMIVLGGGDGPVPYRISGSVSVQARVTLRVTESITNELMWTRSLDLGSIQVDFESENTYTTAELSLNNLLQREGSFYSNLGIALEDQYANVLQTTWDFLNPTEMGIVSNQAQELRDRAVFGGN